MRTKHWSWRQFYFKFEKFEIQNFLLKKVCNTPNFTTIFKKFKVDHFKTFCQSVGTKFAPIFRVSLQNTKPYDNSHKKRLKTWKRRAGSCAASIFVSSSSSSSHKTVVIHSGKRKKQLFSSPEHFLLLFTLSLSLSLIVCVSPVPTLSRRPNRTKNHQGKMKKTRSETLSTGTGERVLETERRRKVSASLTLSPCRVA